MYQSRDLERICRIITTEIEDELSRAGIFFRIFSRVKSSNSANKKIIAKGQYYYDGKIKFLRDIIGIRIILYFSDDLPIVNQRLKEYFELVEETIDKNEETKFAPTRENLILRLPHGLIKEFSDILNNKIFDTTFELQLRTILSEGWHEVEHDLRYKCKEDWKNHLDLARNFNGILASIETSEYSILRLFEQMSYRHYKSKDIIAMMRTKFRLRFMKETISDELRNLLTDEIVKEIFKLERIEVLSYLFSVKSFLPLTMENLVYIVNYSFIKNKKILEITPEEILIELKLI